MAELAPRAGWRAAGLAAATALLAACALLSLVVGSRSVPLHSVVDALFAHDSTSGDQEVIRDSRVPRTILGLLVGVALGLSGALMQGVTRNPLADPGILGITAGATLAVALAVLLLDVSSLLATVPFAFVGAAVGAAVVYAIANTGREGPTPVKLAVAGTAASALFSALTTLIVLRDVDTLDGLRFWLVGSVAERGWDTVVKIAPFIAVGTLLALTCGRVLNALNLGEHVARSLGQDVERARLLVGVAVVLLAGAATAAAGPVVFVGLVAPHIARRVVGADYRWVLPYSAVIAGIMLVSADVLGRVIDKPQEVGVSVVTALVGGPLFIAIVRRGKTAEL